MNTKTRINKKVAGQIKNRIDEKGLKYNFLAAKLLVSEGHFTNILKGKRTLKQDLLDRINVLLESDFKL